jgi:uncharacterized protein (UPF0262 family)
MHGLFVDDSYNQNTNVSQHILHLTTIRRVSDDAMMEI